MPDRAPFEFALQGSDGKRLVSLSAVRSDGSAAAALTVGHPDGWTSIQITPVECESLALALQQCAREKTGAAREAQVAR